MAGSSRDTRIVVASQKDNRNVFGSVGISLVYIVKRIARTILP